MSDVRPDELYHYTTAHGLLGIITSKQLWASDFRFLNDEQEVRFAVEGLLERLPQLGNLAAEPTHRFHGESDSFGEAFAEYRESVTNFLTELSYGTYIACFCASGDLLSQWKGYTDAFGYAIGVSTAELQKLVVTPEEDSPTEPDDFVGGLTKVDYGLAGAETLIAAAINEISAETNLGHLGVKSYYAAQRAITRLARFKDQSWAEEQEWRVVCNPEFADTPPSPRFRTSVAGIVPYVELDLPDQAFTTVVVGPGGDQATRAVGVQALLDANEIDAQVRRSAIPLRR